MLWKWSRNWCKQGGSISNVSKISKTWQSFRHLIKYAQKLKKKLIGIYKLAVLYEKGAGCLKNEKKSMKLYALAAYLGEPAG